MRGFSTAVIVCTCLTPVSAQEWSIEEVGDVGMYSDLAVDAEGTPHVALSGSGEVLYATRGSRGWKQERVAAFDANVMAAQVAIDLDERQRPAILFANGELELARRRSGWKHEPVLDVFHGNGECQLELVFRGDEPWVYVHDPYKAPAIQVGHGRRMRFKALAQETEDGGGLAIFEDQAYAVWQDEREGPGDPVVYAVSSGNRFGEPVVLVEDSAVAPKVAAADGALFVLSAERKSFSKVLRLHTLREGSWTTQVVGDYRLVGAPCVPHLATGPEGRPHLLFAHNEEDGTSAVTYARRDADGAWKTSVVTREVGSRMSLAIDGQGRPHVTYAAGNRSNTLFYATPRGELSFTRGAVQPEETTGVAGPRGGSSTQPASSARTEAAEEGGPQAVTGPEAEAIAAEVRDRAERWFALRDVKKLACSTCDGTAFQACARCRGTLKVSCKSCGGEGKIKGRRAAGNRSTSRSCQTCSTRGQVDCTACDKGQQSCGGCEDTPRYRGLAGTRAFWKPLSPSARRDRDRESFVTEVLAGEASLDVFGAAPSLHRARIQRVDVFANEVRVVAEVHWAGEADGETSTLTTTWIREDGRFYVALGSEDREPLLGEETETRRAPASDSRRDSGSAGQADKLIRLARNYIDNGALSSAVKKLEQAKQETLTPEQQEQVERLLARCKR